MCRLLGVAANKPVDIRFSLERFKALSDKNPDGWGIGWYEGENPRIFKEAISAGDKNSQLPRLSEQVHSNIIIAHVREGTKGPPSKDNSHPFAHENWIFAHNGSVDRDYLHPLLHDEYRSEIKGETDSEVYFLWILQNILQQKDVVKGTRSAVKEVIKRDYTGLNFLLSHKNTLFAFRYSSKERKRYSLYFLKRPPSDLNSWESMLSHETWAEILSRAQKGEKFILVCSEKLTEENWNEVKFGHLFEISPDLVVRDHPIL